ncbi:hypothetical protein [Nocardia arthritidis]|uniref:hypothetical protein n=1 Tax=Nocardia arthritidis TaxID=228602 RepID=UPI00142E5DE8|nr:hypothetical protein [Nocardia arthritidis]
MCGVGFLVVVNLRKWQPGRVKNFAAGSLVLPTVSAVMQWSWTGPVHTFTQGVQVAWAGWVPGGVVGMAVVAVPVAWWLVAWWWARYYHKLVTVGHTSPEKTDRVSRRFEDARDAGARTAARYPVPLTYRGNIVLGPSAAVASSRSHSVWGLLRKRRDRWLMIPVRAINEHLVVTGDSGSGKTTMLLRLIAGLYAYDWQRYLATRKDRPLLVFIDCGGDLHTGRRFVQLMTRLGVDPRRIGLWPITTKLDLWSMSAPDLTETLQSMLCLAPATDASQVHFENNRRRVVSLVIGTALSDAGVVLPKPRSRAELFDRLSTKRLKQLYAADLAICEEIDALNESKPPAVADVAGKLRDLFETLGEAFEGDRGLDSFDALYVCAQGTTRKETARAQISAVKTMLLQFAASPHNRRIRTAMDEKSAVVDDKGDVDVIDLVERARKLRCSVIYAAQSFLGLAQTEDECHRIVASTSGGWIGMRGNDQGPLCEKFGTRTVYTASRHLNGRRMGEEGTLNTGDAMLVHPNKLRRFEPGQAVYVKGLQANWGQVVTVDPDDIPQLEYPHWARIEPATATAGHGEPESSGPQRKTHTNRPIARRADIERPRNRKEDTE